MKTEILLSEMPLGKSNSMILSGKMWNLIFSLMIDYFEVGSYQTYHLASVVDDHEMGVTHVIRADNGSPQRRNILFYTECSAENTVFSLAVILLR